MPDGLISAPLGSKLYRTSTEKKVESGDQITTTTDDPTTNLVLSEKIMDIQWVLNRIASITGAAEPRDEVFKEDDDVSDTGALFQCLSAAFQSLSIHQLLQSKDKDAPKAVLFYKPSTSTQQGEAFVKAPSPRARKITMIRNRPRFSRRSTSALQGRGVREGFEPKAKKYTDQQERYGVRKRLSGRTRLSRLVMKKDHSSFVSYDPPLGFLN